MLHFGELDQHISEGEHRRGAGGESRGAGLLVRRGPRLNCNDRASYNAEAAKLAKERSLKFLKKHLG